MHRGCPIEKKRGRRTPPERHFKAQPAFRQLKRNDPERMIDQVYRDICEHHEARYQAQSPNSERCMWVHGSQTNRCSQSGRISAFMRRLTKAQLLGGCGRGRSKWNRARV
jgi:hypothetical protein